MPYRQPPLETQHSRNATGRALRYLEGSAPCPVASPSLGGSNDARALLIPDSFGAGHSPHLLHSVNRIFSVGIETNTSYMKGRQRHRAPARSLYDASNWCTEGGEWGFLSDRTTSHSRDRRSRFYRFTSLRTTNRARPRGFVCRQFLHWNSTQHTASALECTVRVSTPRHLLSLVRRGGRHF
jgi:hypothetical protein